MKAESEEMGVKGKPKAIMGICCKESEGSWKRLLG
jgi:hypothetical protein